MEPWRKNLYISWASQLLCILGFSAVFPFIPFYLQDLGVTDSNQVKLWTGWISTGGQLTMAVFAPIWGSLADRYGRKIMVERAAFGGAIMVLLIAFATSAPQLLVLRTIQGVFSGTVAAFTTLVVCSTPRNKVGFSLGMMQMAVYSGSSGGPLLGGLIADHFGYRAAFMACAGMLLLGGLIAWRLVREEFTPVQVQRSNFMHEARDLFTHKAIVVMLVVLFSLNFTNSMVKPLLPLFIQSLQASEERLATITGLIQGAAALSSAIAAAMIGRVSDRLGHRRVLLACALGAAALYLPQAFVKSTGQFFALEVLLGIFLGGLIPSANAVIALAVDEAKRGATYGLTASAGSAGRAFGPALGSAVAVSRDIRALFPTATVLYMVIALWVALTVPRAKRAEAAKPIKSG